jgi:hypothetical protein
MRRNMIGLAVLALALILIAGCAGLGQKATPVPPTKTPKPTFTSTPNATPTQVVFPTATQPPATATQPPTATTEPSPAPTATAVAQKFSATQTVNVRRGPGTNYQLAGTIDAGSSFDITGKNSGGDWLQFNYNGQPGWVSAGLVSVTADLGAVQVAQNIPAPPPTSRPPPPAPPTAPPAPAAPPAPPQPTFPFQLVKGVEKCEPNEGTTYYNGFVRYRSNAPRNGVCVHTAFYGPRTTKCSGCDGVGDGVWGFSPFNGKAPPGTTVEVFIVPCPSGGIPTGGKGNNFGDLTPQSDKWVHTFSKSEQCTGITFVGD